MRDVQCEGDLVRFEVEDSIPLAEALELSPADLGKRVIPFLKLSGLE